MVIEAAEILGLVILVFVLLVFMLRISGKRTTSKMNSFDWVVSVALGSMTAATMLGQVELHEGLVGLGGLIFVQVVVATLEQRFSWFQKIIKAKPRLLFLDGTIEREALREERISEVELFSAVRSAGLSSLEEVQAIVMETNSDLSVIQKSEQGGRDFLRNVEGLEGFEE